MGQAGDSACNRRVFLAGVLHLAYLVKEVEAGICSYVDNSLQVFHFQCRSYQYCCGFSCCLSPALSFYRLWYFWLLMLLAVLVCSGGGCWYRLYRRPQPDRAGLFGNTWYSWYGWVPRRFSRQEHNGFPAHEHPPFNVGHQQHVWSYFKDPPPYSQEPPPYHTSWMYPEPEEVEEDRRHSHSGSQASGTAPTPLRERDVEADEESQLPSYAVAFQNLPMEEQRRVSRGSVFSVGLGSIPGGDEGRPSADEAGDGTQKLPPVEDPSDQRRKRDDP
ncbi:unnamed protein product [Darwinula stevensoni]|uniref:WW domain binding protein VOPP1 n=1 Tax=Darwinula stevensoni TaxID=69355 RepID=A0A7R8X650_9CRUS|nr:unnamed protein product [Darwinula stevensoni]CAG0887733.1 unnamed protein product [Darwinula stevensoni]